jgi:hypothetical protein
MTDLNQRLAEIESRLNELYEASNHAWKAQDSDVTNRIDSEFAAQKERIADTIVEAHSAKLSVVKEAALDLLIQHTGEHTGYAKYLEIADRLSSLDVFTRAYLMERVKEGPMGRWLGRAKGSSTLRSGR